MEWRMEMGNGDGGWRRMVTTTTSDNTIMLSVGNSSAPRRPNWSPRTVRMMEEAGMAGWAADKWEMGKAVAGTQMMEEGT